MMLVAIMSMPSMRKGVTSLPRVLSNLYAVGSNSLRVMATIMPEISPKDMPNTRGPNRSFRMSHPRRAPAQREGGREGRCIQETIGMVEWYLQGLIELTFRTIRRTIG